MPDRGYGSCKRCGVDFMWGLTEKGRRMPVDLQPRPDGNLACYRDAQGTLRVRVVAAAAPILPYEKPGIPHAATCSPTPAQQPLATTAGGAVSLADARRRRSNAQRQVP